MKIKSLINISFLTATIIGLSIIGIIGSGKVSAQCNVTALTSNLLTVGTSTSYALTLGPAASNRIRIGVTSTSDCTTWTVSTSDQDWFMVDKPTEGGLTYNETPYNSKYDLNKGGPSADFDDGSLYPIPINLNSVSIIVEANTTSSTRTGIITIGAKTIALTQNPNLPGTAGAITITGGAYVKQGQKSVRLSVAAITYALRYTWTLPTGVTFSAGTNPNSNSISVDFADNMPTGLVPIKVQGTNDIVSVGQIVSQSGTASPNLNVTVVPCPTAYNVTGGGSYCAGGSGVAVGLDSSQIGFNYQLKLNGSPIGSAKTGTGHSLKFDLQTYAGNYTVEAKDVYQLVTPMQGTATVAISALPSAAEAISVEGEFYPGAKNLIYSVPVIQNASSYTWTLPSSEASIVPPANTNRITVNYTTSALPGTITVKGTNSCGDGTPSSMDVKILSWNKKNNNLYYTLGNVGIGTTNPTAKLAVNGDIKAKEVKVTIEAVDWPDFVFNANHKLRTLGEVEQFIKTNNHLPEIPSESEVKQNGVGLGEMNAKLLQKIEELTLYMIDQQKQLNELKEQNAKLTKEIEALKNK